MKSRLFHSKYSINSFALLYNYSPMRPNIILPVLPLLLCAGCNNESDPSAVSEPASGHPFLLFNARDVAGLAQRGAADPLLAECYTNLQSSAHAKPEDEWWTDRLESVAFVSLVGIDSAGKQQAIELLLSSLRSEDPEKFYKKAD